MMDEKDDINLPFGCSDANWLLVTSLTTIVTGTIADIAISKRPQLFTV